MAQQAVIDDFVDGLDDAVRQPGSPACEVREGWGASADELLAHAAAAGRGFA